MSDLIVGIDLGTTNSAVSIVMEGQVQVIPVHGKQTMPSCVGISPAGQLIVGEAAKNQLISSPESTLVSIKRKMGESTQVALGDHHFSPEEVSSFILRELKIEAEKFLKQPVKKAVITVPAFFNEHQRKATQVAGELAKLEVVRIINEPTAAALAYGADQVESEKLLVYDLGGGTFDVSVVLVEDGVVEVKSSHGDTFLGGDDFDEILVQHALAEFGRMHGVEVKLTPAMARRLKVIMERAKCELSDKPFVKVREEYLTAEHHLELEITREQYEEMIQSWIEKTLTCVHQSLSDANLKPADVDKVMLVGGSTRTPLVHDLIQSRFGLTPRSEINPDLIVSMGAAVQGAIIAGMASHSILVDITPHTFSTACLDGYSGMKCAPIIHRNTALPTVKTEEFYTAVDSQDTVRVTAYQGESERPEGNMLVGEFNVQGLSKVPSGNPILIEFGLDLNGMLKVTAIEKRTQLAKTVVMDTRGAGYSKVDASKLKVEDFISTMTPYDEESLTETLEAMSIEALEEEVSLEAEALEGDESRDLIVSAKDLKKRAIALLEKNISEEDKVEINSLLEASQAAILARDWKALQHKNDSLSDLLFYLED